MMMMNGKTKMAMAITEDREFSAVNNKSFMNEKLKEREIFQISI